MTFRFSASSAFLTYAQCPLNKESLLAFLESNYDLTAYCVAEEEHEDGSPHLHAVVRFADKINSRNQRLFDFEGYHPNIQTPRSLKNAVLYCQKDGEFICHGFTYTAKREWHEAFNAESKEEFMEAVKTISPKDYILCLERIEYTANKLYAPPSSTWTPKYELTTFTIPHAVQVWKEQLNVPRPKSLLLIGESRLGKTQLIRTMFPTATYWYSMINLDTFTNDSPIAIFDDFEWDKIPCKKGWIGAQDTIVVSDKYRKKRTIEWGRPCVILMNEMPILSAWDRANLIVCTVLNKLY